MFGCGFGLDDYLLRCLGMIAPVCLRCGDLFVNSVDIV